MSKKKQSRTSSKASKTESPSIVIERCLKVANTNKTDFETVSAQFLQFAESATDASQPQLAAVAERMSQLAELATTDIQEGDGGMAGDIRSFLLENMNIAIGVDGNDNAIDAAMSAASEKWGDYLEAFQDFPEDFSDVADPWDSSFDHPGLDSQSTNNEIDDVENYDTQIDLMLSAINGLETSGDAATPDGPVNDSPTEMFTESNDANGSLADAEGDAAAIDQLRADHEMLEAYLDDANGCVASMERSVLQLESTPNQSAPVRQFCRELHTLKGASATVGLSGLATFLHNLETSLEQLFDGDQCNAQPDQLLKAVDTVRERISCLAQPSAPVANADNAHASAGSPEAAPLAVPKLNLSDAGGEEASIRIRAAHLDRLMDMLAELVVLKNRRESHLTEFNRLNEELTRCSTRLRFVNDADSGQTNADSTMAAEISRDLAELGNELRSLQKPISTDNQAISWFVRDFRQELMQLRRMPVAGLFQRLQRAARDAAKLENKQVQVQMLGTETGLEKELQEALYEPLIHIVRNAVGHGIEQPADREQAGKSNAGTITLEAKSSAQMLVIEVRDDGNGLDYDAVRKRARDKGLLSAHATPSESELAKLIFHPGFSTANQVSELSGRGVGMDVVATAIEQMHGRIEITSQRGQGTTMRFTIPLRSGIEHVLVFRSAGQLFALPMQSVQTTRQKSNSDNVAAGRDLAQVLSLRSHSNQAQNTIVMRESSQAFGADTTARKAVEFAVDDIVGPEEVVVRSLPGFLDQNPLFCGLTLSGTSETVLLIDAERLEEFCETHFDGRSEQPADQSTAHCPTMQRVLVVDDSLSARKNLTRKLAAAGYAITEAGDGLAALECLRKESFDLVFTDLDMPQMGGLELLADLQRGPHSEIPVVVVSGRAEQDFRDRATEAGAADYLTKPATEEQLNAVLENLKPAAVDP